MSTVKTLWRLAICKEGQGLFSVREWKTMQCALPYHSTCILCTRHKRRAPKYSSVFQIETSFIKLAQMKKNIGTKKIAYLKVHVNKSTETILWWLSFYLAQNQSWSILLPCVYHILYTFSSVCINEAECLLWVSTLDSISKLCFNQYCLQWQSAMQSLLFLSNLRWEIQQMGFTVCFWQEIAWK